jgi:hypothetical protein
MVAHQPHFAYWRGGGEREMDVLLPNSIYQILSVLCLPDYNIENEN